MPENLVYYRVRTEGDGEYDYFEHSPENDDNGYDDTDLEEAQAVADELGGWVVKITEEIL